MANLPNQFDLGVRLPFTKPYLDSSFFLAHIKKELIPGPDGNTRFDITSGILTDAQAGKLQIFTSVITLAEVRRLKEAKKELTEEETEEVNKVFREFLEHEWLGMIEVNREIGEKPRTLERIIV